MVMSRMDPSECVFREEPGNESIESSEAIREVFSVLVRKMTTRAPNATFLKVPVYPSRANILCSRGDTRGVCSQGTQRTNKSYNLYLFA